MKVDRNSEDQFESLAQRLRETGESIRELDEHAPTGRRYASVDLLVAIPEDHICPCCKKEVKDGTKWVLKGKDGIPICRSCRHLQLSERRGILLVGSVLKQVRIDNGWTQQKLADALQVSQPMIAKMERAEEQYLSWERIDLFLETGLFVVQSKPRRELIGK